VPNMTSDARDTAAVAENLFETSSDGPQLIGGRRKSDGRITFPLPRGVESELYEPIRLDSTGQLWSFTVQRFRPKSPPYVGADDDATFKPFALGYIELANQVIVESRIEVDNFARLKIGMAMRLELVPFRCADGATVTSYVFRPV
jgi:uncharacterized protein